MASQNNDVEIDRGFGDVLIEIHAGMASCGRAKGVSIDEEARVIHIENPLGSVQELNIDSPGARENATFATRLAPALYPTQAGARLLYQAPMEQHGTSTRFCDVTMMLASDPSKAVAGFEIKIVAGADPRRKIEDGKGQLLDYMRRMMTAGQLAPVAAMSFIVFSEAALLNPKWKSSGYFNAQGGPGSMSPSKNGDEFLEQCKEQIARHGMVCGTWVFDLSSKEKMLAVEAALSDKSLFEKVRPVSFSLPFVGEFPMGGKGHIVGQGETCVVFAASAETIGLAPTSNPSGASLLQNTRGFKQKPVEKPGEARSNVIIERVKGGELKKITEEEHREIVAGYSGVQTGANMRRIMAMRDESRWTILPTGPNGSLLLVSTNAALSDSQSSTACFSSMARAAKRSFSYEDFCQAMDEEMLFFGIHPEVPRRMAAKMMEGCRTPAERVARFLRFKNFIMAPQFEVKIEFPTTQDEATQSSQAANQVYPQSSVDLSIAEQRQFMQAMHDVGKRLARLMGCEFPFDLPKHFIIEQSETMPISELAQAHYTGDSAQPEVYGGAETSDKNLSKQLDQVIGGAQLQAGGGAYALDEEHRQRDWLLWAARSAMCHSQALSRCGFEGASDSRRLKKSINFLLPDLQRISDLTMPVWLAFDDGLTELGSTAAISRGQAALKAQRRLVIKEGSRLSAAQRSALDEIFERLDEAMDPEAAAEYGEDYMRKHFKHVHDKHLKAGYATLESDKLLRLARLVGMARVAATEARSSGLGSGVSLSVEMIARLIYASAQCSWKDGSLNTTMAFGSWERELSARITFAAERVVQKLNHLAVVCGKVGIEDVKGLGKGSLSSARYHGGKCAMALPESWRSTEEIDGESRVVFPAYRNAATWLMNAGLSVDGDWSPSASITDADVPLLLICAS